ncbi:MAG: glycerol dehydratase reactivase beta/small subunit family protein [Lachnospiraceae bacterium]|nr:glycerol dehydratase reactivase beta/small subunit family protein [Lachnospiraceae bacterium]
MEMNKPAVHLYTADEHLPSLVEICAGLEEEGVPWKLLRMEGTAKELAFRAAQDSVLETGIGLTGQAAALQIRRVPADRPVFFFANPTAEQSRALGINAARAVKKRRFVEQ